MPTIPTSAKRLVVLVSGSGSNFQSIAENCAQGKINGEIVAVISDNTKAYGLERAKNLNIHAIVHPFNKQNREQWEYELSAKIAQLEPNYIVLAGFMKVLSADFVKRFDGKVVNIHPSLLPKYKGLNTHQRAIDAGDNEAGCTVHIVTEKLDDGPILGQRRVPILKEDTADSLAQRVIKEEHKLYSEVLAQLCSS